MRRILAVAHSYYMLLTLIQMRETVLKGDTVDILISDASANSEIVFKNMKETGIFNSCFYYRLSDIGWKKGAGAKEKTVKLLKGTLRYKKIIQKLGIDPQYDILLVYMANRFDEQIIYNAIKKNNPNATCELYEEGYSSYFSIYGVLDIYGKKYLNLLSKYMTFIGKKRFLIENNIDKAWYFNPEMLQYKGNFKVCAIPKFNSENTAITKLMNQVFGYSGKSNIPQRIIFLEGCSFTDGMPTDDLEILNLIAERIGTKNIAVKLHPRTRKDRFKEFGYNTEIENIPLELMVLNSGSKGKILVTMESGSPISCILNFENESKVILLFKCSKVNNAQMADPHFEEHLRRTAKLCSKNQLLIPENDAELCDCIDMLQFALVRNNSS